MKRIIYLLICAIAVISCCIPICAGEGDPNIDDGGGETDGGDIVGGNYWNVGDDGVRVTVVKEASRASVTLPVDFSNADTSNIQRHFGKKNKLQHGSLQPDTSTQKQLSQLKFEGSIQV